MKKMWLIAAVLGVVAGFLLGRGCRGHVETIPPGAAPESSVHGEEMWTCSMHPQIRKPGPGLCPICAMALIPVVKDVSGDVQELPRGLVLSETARALAEVETAPVERRAVSVEVRLTGKVALDETGMAVISPRVSGRIDRLFADYAGMAVNRGDHLADLYSPDLLSAQQELLVALKGGGQGESRNALLETARERLRLWGLTSEQIAAIEQRGVVSDHLTFYAPIGGVVVELGVREGEYVDTGTRLFTVADLSRVWVLLDVYESDLAWIRYGQPVEFTVEALPGDVFTGTVGFISPVVDPVARTVSARVTVTNTGGRLKPGMFVRATVRASVTEDGQAAPADLSGTWMCPMHPEVMQEEPGTCGICGMALVPAEGSERSADERESLLPLVIPASAPLITGRRAVVYTSVPGVPGGYEGREVVLGPRAGDYYLVADGLAEGEQVVTRGNFKIDSALQIQGKPGMMTQTETPGILKGVAPQTVCPIMGGAVNRKEYTDYKGLRIYFCCPGCVETFNRDPEKVVAAMRAAGIEPEHLEGETHEH